jgi:hypothetical protein
LKLYVKHCGGREKKADTDEARGKAAWEALPADITGEAGETELLDFTDWAKGLLSRWYSQMKSQTFGDLVRDNCLHDLGVGPHPEKKKKKKRKRSGGGGDDDEEEEEQEREEALKVHQRLVKGMLTLVDLDDNDYHLERQCKIPRGRKGKETDENFAMLLYTHAVTKESEVCCLHCCAHPPLITWRARCRSRRQLP